MNFRLRPIFIIYSNMSLMPFPVEIKKLSLRRNSMQKNLALITYQNLATEMKFHIKPAQADMFFNFS